MRFSRRMFFKVTGAAAAASVVGRPVDLSGATVAADARAMLVDTTRCIGCRACEAACAEANGLPGPSEGAPLGTRRTTDQHTFTVVNAFAPAEGGEARFVKSQCMHCVDPSCASACLVKALEKTPEGPVVYHADRCLGCRYCMVACPFGVPKFEYEKAVPYVRKCSFCAARQAEGKMPACAEVCPSGALQFGTRGELLEEAKTRIYQNPDRYVHQVYGEHEVGGTSWLYLADAPFEEVGLRTDLGTTAYPEFTWPFLSAVPLVLMLWPPFLMGLYAFSRARGEADGDDRETAEPGTTRGDALPPTGRDVPGRK